MFRFLMALAWAFAVLWAQGQVSRCGSAEYLRYLEGRLPGFEARYEAAFADALGRGKAPGYVRQTLQIPVVFHVVYNTAGQNLADSVLMDQVAVLNEDYGRGNADTAQLRSVFAGLGADAGIEFVLATVDPWGMPTTGITRTQTSKTTFADPLSLISGDFSSLEEVKFTASGGRDGWDRRRYLNIWVCNMAIEFLGQSFPLLLGYATPPPGLPNWPTDSAGLGGLGDGVVLQFETVGRNNPNPLVAGDPFGGGSTTLVVRGRTATHEVGHYLGLRHIWGDGDCTMDDGLADTPDAEDASPTDCDTSRNTCVDVVPGYGDLPDMIENFMDYSSEDCQNVFTHQQVGLMRGVLLPGGYRDTLLNWTLAGLGKGAAGPRFTAVWDGDGEAVVLDLQGAVGGTAGVRLLDAQGRAVGRWGVAGAGSGRHALAAGPLAGGVYFVEVESGGVRRSVALVVGGR